MSTFFELPPTNISGTLKVDGYIINPSNAVDGYALIYQNSSGSFIPKVVSGGGGSGGYSTIQNNGSSVPQETIINLSPRLSAADASSKTFLDLATSGISGGNHQGIIFDAYGRATGLGSAHLLVDGYTIDLSGGATTNQVLQYNGTSFIAGTVSGGGGGVGTTGQTFINLVQGGGRSSYNSATPLAVGSCVFNPNNYTLTGTTLSVVLRGIAANGNTGLTSHIKLVNITDSEDVATLSFTTTTEAKQDTVLTIGTSSGNIKTSEKIYEFRIYVDSPISGGDTIELYHAELRVINTIN